MKRRQFLASAVGVTTAVTLATGTARAAKEAGRRQRLRVMTYNIFAGRNRDASHDHQRIAEIILGGRPDLVALQEVDVNTRRNGGIDLAGKLGKLTGMWASFGRAINFQGGEYGNAVLSRHPILECRTHVLPALGGEARSAAEIRVKVPGIECPVSFVSTHLDHRSPEVRAVQIAALRRALPAEDHLLRLVAGDFNASPDSAVIHKWLAAGWVDLAPECWRNTPTFSTIRPQRRIDYLFAQAPFELKVAKYAVGPAVKPDDADFAERVRTASDHLPVVAEIALL